MVVFCSYFENAAEPELDDIKEIIVDDNVEDWVLKDDLNLVGRKLVALHPYIWFIGDIIYFIPSNN